MSPPTSLDRVYDSTAAHVILGYQPRSPTARLPGLDQPVRKPVTH